MEFDQAILEQGLQFFNTTDHQYSEVDYAMDKADGSLISTYLDGAGLLNVKSKGSLYSDHAVAAMEYVNNNVNFKGLLNELEDAGFTVNMEWVSPDPKFRIVLHYPEARLIILNIRNRETGEYIDISTLGISTNHRVVHYNNEVLKDLDTQTGIEGYVVVDMDGNWYKLKTPWYLERHRAKDFINQPNAFVELVLKDEADDVFSLVADQPPILEEMKELQHLVITKANTIVNAVTLYYETNKDLSRKDYAIKGKAELVGYEFPLAMQYFVKREEPDWKGFLLQVSKKIIWGIRGE